MAKKISQLTQATEVKSDDVTVIVQDGETKKLPLNMMVTKQDIENKKVTGLAKLDEIEATYENDTYTPTIAVKNKSSVKVGEGDGVDYSANVMDGPAKSAILSGCTLVNLIDYGKPLNSYITKDNDTLTVVSQSDVAWFNSAYLLNCMTYEKKYRVMWDSLTYTHHDRHGAEQIIGVYSTDSTNNKQVVIGFNKNDNSNYFDFTIPSNAKIDRVSIRIHSATFTGEQGATTTVKGLKVLEYQEGMENWDIPYFEGMQSVKMPVLTTIGKNVFDEKQVPEQLSWGNNVKKANVKENTTYVYSSSPYTGYVSIKFYDNNDNEIKQGISINSGTSFTTPPNTSYLKCHTDKDSLVQFEEGSTSTPYEPFKSNILTVNEPVELRGIGDVRDTLNCLTGEVTERIGEIMLNESLNYQGLSSANGENTMYFQLDLGAYPNSIPVSSHFKVSSANLYISTNDYEGIRITSSGSLQLRVLKSKLNSLDVNGLKEYLKQNNISLQYQLATESIKTVDLIPSGTHPSTTPYCWKDGHIQLSSSGLLPSLEYSVVTSRAGQISQNTAMIVKNDKRIFDLEILLAGGLVNTTYQALTLQNQVETGLSKVSLSSEKEPDYLLYHMIMKLIEEKAYKLDDLAEKVSVFYLYEKLSDEQFETIYAALYPFAEDEYFESDIPGDDEVIEEPIVDESLEEVEDEVVM